MKIEKNFNISFQLASEYGIQFMETSAKGNIVSNYMNIFDIFNILLECR